MHSLIPAFVKGLAFSLIPALMAYLAKRRRFQAERSGQWCYLSAGPTERFLATSCFVAALVVGYIAFLSGTSYPRSRGDMVAVIALVLMFLVPSLVMYLVAFKVYTRWNGERIEQQRFCRRRKVIHLKDIVGCGITPVSSYFWFASSDRTIIYISRDAHGSGELVKLIAGDNQPMVLRPVTVGLG